MEALGEAVEEAYHMIAGGKGSQGLRYSNRICILLWGEAPALVRIWAQAMRSGERDLVKGASLGWGQAWVHAVDEHFREHEQPTIELMSRLLEEEELEEEEQVTALTIRGDLYFDQSRLDLALADADAAIEVGGKQAGLLYERAWAKLRREGHEAATEDAEAALIAAGDEPASKYWDLYLRCLSALLEPGEILELIEAVTGGDRQPSLLRAKGRALRQLDDGEGAVATFKRIEEVSEGHRHMAIEEVAVTEAGQEAWVKALEHFERALEADPTCVACWRGLAGVGARTMEPDEVEELLLETCEDSELPGTRAGRAVALLGLDRDWGFAELEQAMSGKPDEP